METRTPLVSHIFSDVLVARFVRITALEWGGGAPALRFELYGQGVEEAVGMQNGAVTDSQISASSQQLMQGNAKSGRLHGKDGWVAAQNDDAQWLQIDLRARRPIVAVATQGRVGDQLAYVSTYELELSNDGDAWTSLRTPVHEGGGAVVFSGNSDANTAVTHYLPQPVFARFVRFVPKSWCGAIGMRVEVYTSSSTTQLMENDESVLENATDIQPTLLESSEEVRTNRDEGGQEESTIRLVPLSIAPPPQNLPKVKATVPESIRPRVGMFVSARGDSDAGYDAVEGVLRSISMDGSTCEVWFMDKETGAARLQVRVLVKCSNFLAHSLLFRHLHFRESVRSENATATNSTRCKTCLTSASSYDHLSPTTMHGVRSLNYFASGSLHRTWKCW